MEANKNNTTVEEKATEDQKKFFLDLLPGKLIDIQFNNPIQVRFKLTLIGYDTGTRHLRSHDTGSRCPTFTSRI